MRRATTGATLFTLLILASGAPVAAAGPAGETATYSAARASVRGTQVEVRAGHTTSQLRPLLATERSTAAAPTADIQVSYNSSFPAAAREAFEAAAGVWESRIVSSQVIRVDATWQPMGSGVLGSAGPTFIYLLPDNFWYPAALREAMCSCNVSSTEIGANFNSSFSSWYLGTDGNAPSGKYDFFTVVLHELGHGLGFISSFRLNSRNKGTWGYASDGVRYPMRYDVNEWTAATNGKRLTNTSAFPNPSGALRNELTDGSVYFGGQNVVETLGGRAKLYAPLSWSYGSSNAHFDEDAFPRGTENALMTPFLSNGEVIHDPGPLTLALFRDIGWQTSGSASGDQAPPTVHPPRAGFATPQAVGSTVTVEVSWQAAEDQSGIAGYNLQRKKNSGAWTNVALPSPTSTSAEIDLAPGNTYRFRLAATDTAGNTSAYVSNAAAKLARAQETAAGVSYSGAWTRVALGGASDGYVRRSTSAGDTATYAFSGSAAGLVSTLGPNRGVAQLRLDGVLVGTIDLYAPTLQPAQLVWADEVGTGSHDLEVRVTSSANPSSSGTRVDVDAFVAWK